MSAGRTGEVGRFPVSWQSVASHGADSSVSQDAGQGAAEPLSGNEASNFAEVVCYSDTDAGGVVHHAAYLRWLERARTAWVRGHGVTLTALAGRGCVFMVRKMELEYIEPLRLDDEIGVTARVAKIGRCSAWFVQEVLRGETATMRAKVLMVSLDTTTGRPRLVPKEVVGWLESAR